MAKATQKGKGSDKKTKKSEKKPLVRKISKADLERVVGGVTYIETSTAKRA